MKLFMSALALCSATLILAVPFATLTRRDGIESCDECADHLDMCMKYATAEGISGCEDICMSRLCRKWPDCRDCDEKYDQCTDRNN